MTEPLVNAASAPKVAKVILVTTPDDEDTIAYTEYLSVAFPHSTIYAWQRQQMQDLESSIPKDHVQYIVLWGAIPSGFFAQFPNLSAVFSLGAGVDKILNTNAQLPIDIPVYRLLDAGMAQQMAEYVRYGVLGFQRHMDLFKLNQSSHLWKPYDYTPPSQVHVGILGVGEMGGVVAKALLNDGYTVRAWSRSQRPPTAITSESSNSLECFHGDAGLDIVLSSCNVIVCLLPLTPETKHILSSNTLAKMQRGSMVINAGRGDLINNDALLEAINSGHIRCAQLDVFPVEPLPQDHALWVNPRVFVTPHIAALTLREPAAGQVIANIQRLGRGEEGLGRVERTRGY